MSPTFKAPPTARSGSRVAAICTLSAGTSGASDSGVGEPGGEELVARLQVGRGDLCADGLLAVERTRLLRASLDGAQLGGGLDGGGVRPLRDQLAHEEHVDLGFLGDGFVLGRLHVRDQAERASGGEEHRKGDSSDTATIHGVGLPFVGGLIGEGG